MSSAFIDDGYTREADFPETQYYPAARITFRPMLRSERLRLVNRSVKASEETDRAVLEASAQVAASIARHLVSWNLVDRNDQPVPIAADRVERLEPHLFEKIYNAVAGFAEEEATAKN